MSFPPPNRAPTQPSRYRDESFDERRNDQALDNDNAPLLYNKDDQPAWSMSKPPKNIKAIRVLTALTLTSSVLAAMVLVALRIYDEQETWGDYGLKWPTRAGSRAVGITVNTYGPYFTSLCETDNAIFRRYSPSSFRYTIWLDCRRTSPLHRC